MPSSANRNVGDAACRRSSLIVVSNSLNGQGASGTPMVCVSRLGVRYGKTWAVRQLSFDVPRGSFFGLIGRNGAGKSTTLKAILTLLPMHEGSVTVDDMDGRRDRAAIRQLLGYVPQSLSVDGALTAREHLTLFARLHLLRRDERRAKIAHLLEMAGLEQVADRPLRTFSGGMVRRVEIAQSLLATPRLLVVDEPTTGLDPVAREAIWAQLDTLRREFALTLIFTTHSLDEAETLADQIAFLRPGGLVGYGPAGSLRDEDDAPTTLRQLFVDDRHPIGLGAENLVSTRGSFNRLREGRKTLNRRS